MAASVCYIMGLAPGGIRVCGIVGQAEVLVWQHCGSGSTVGLVPSSAWQHHDFDSIVDLWLLRSGGILGLVASWVWWLRGSIAIKGLAASCVVES